MSTLNSLIESLKEKGGDSEVISCTIVLKDKIGQTLTIEHETRPAINNSQIR